MSTKITIEMPKEAAEKIIKGIENKDPKLLALLEEFNVLSVEIMKENKCLIQT